MKRFISPAMISCSPYSKTEYMFESLEDCRKMFVQEATKFFIQSWLDEEVQDIWLNWDITPEEEKEFYYAHWEHLRSNGTLIDDPAMNTSYPGSRHTAPIGAFSETMLRWLQASFGPTQLLVEPRKSKATEDGKIDFIEITGLQNNYSSLKVTLWEVKSSDSQISSHNTNVYQQITDYRLRFLSIAACLSESYEGDDRALKTFLGKMGRRAWEKHQCVHYGVFVTYDSSVKQTNNMTPNLHKYPKGHPAQSKEVCHHLALLLIPDFRDIRLEVWKSLHLM